MPHSMSFYMKINDFPVETAHSRNELIDEDIEWGMGLSMQKTLCGTIQCYHPHTKSIEFQYNFMQKNTDFQPILRFLKIQKKKEVQIFALYFQGRPLVLQRRSLYLQARLRCRIAVSFLKIVI